MNKKVLIIGITGQDGAYLAKLLLNEGFEVFGTSRDAELSSFNNLKKLDIFEKVKLYSMSLIDFRSVMQTILEIKPNQIYNLSGQTSVGLSFAQPVETLESISVGTLNILEVIRFHKLDVKFYNAGSSECFGDTGDAPADELTPFRPRSPYAVAKSAAFWQVANYREAYNLYACSGILFNHESPLRPDRFVTKKIIKGVCRIAKGLETKLKLGNLNVTRDWGWAPEYICAMYKMVQLDEPQDIVIATGHAINLIDFVKFAFDYFGLNFSEYIEISNTYIRPTDVTFNCGNPQKAKEVLKWEAKYLVEDVIKLMIEYELDNYKSNFS